MCLSQRGEQGLEQPVVKTDTGIPRAVKGGARTTAGSRVIGRGCARKGSREKIVFACAITPVGGHGQMRWKGVPGRTGSLIGCT